MKTKKFLIYISLFTSILFYACDKDEITYPYSTDGAKTELARTIITGSDGYVGHLFRDSIYSLIEGIDVLEMEILSDAGLAEKMFLFQIDLTNPKITLLASAPNNQNSLGIKQQMTLQAKAQDSENEKVWGAVNGDFFLTTGMPQGIYYRNTVALKTSMNDEICTFFAITKDLNPIIGSYNEYQLYKNDIKEAVGGRVRLMTNGAILSQQNTTKEPRTAIGITADKKVYILVVDGRNFWYSNGMSYSDMARIFKSLNVLDAINLDGGGSSTFIIRKEDGFEEDRFQIRNWPYDNGGSERSVANGLLIVERK